MELEHTFEVPVGIDTAWTHLLDMEKVAACFPGATLTSADGDEYSGTVKVKLGPIQLTYAGAARIVSADEATHTATIEASGNAARSGSTASMKVVAVASAVDEARTEVAMTTDLTITGRPAQFGRGVMAEVGNKILSQFADCLSNTLAHSAAEFDAKPADGGGGADMPAADDAAATGASGGDAGGPSPTPPGTHHGSDADGASIDLLAAVRGSIAKRVLPLLAGLVVLCLWRKKRRKSRSTRASDA